MKKMSVNLYNDSSIVEKPVSFTIIGQNKKFIFKLRIFPPVLSPSRWGNDFCI